MPEQGRLQLRLEAARWHVWRLRFEATVELVYGTRHTKEQIGCCSERCCA